MANNPKRTNLAANTACDAMAALCNSGYLRIYDGTQPATADTAISTQTLLAELTFAATAFASAVAGVATANAIGSDASANASGTATWFRAFKTDGTTAVFDGTAAISGGDLNLGAVVIGAGTVVAVTDLTLTESKG